MELPKNEKTFTFNEKGDTTLKDYEGSFTVKCVLSMFDKRVLEIEKSRLKADVANPSAELTALTIILANLKVRVSDSPEWWKNSDNGNNMTDENIVVTLFDKVMDQEDEWRKELKEKSGATEGK